MKKVFTLVKRDGTVDLKLKDGKYYVTHIDITIKNGVIKYMDNGLWKLIKKKKWYQFWK